jgi:hypothetical protein
MTRKGETDTRRIQRWWPHHVALTAQALRRAENSMPICTAAKDLAGAPRPYRMERDGKELLVFCFLSREAAGTFAERFGGEVL